MSLHYDLTRISKDVRAEQFPPGPRGEMNPVTYAMIFATTCADIGKITAATAAEFYARVHLIERIDGVLVSRFDSATGERIEGIQRQDVVGHIGLRTNVFYLSRSQWLKRRVTYRLDQDANSVELLLPRRESEPPRARLVRERGANS